jgi:ribosomal protein S18 acetylase RimI-like enzyme
MEQEKNIKYEKINHKHLKGLADLHLEVSTEENFLPLLGEKCMMKFYEWWILRDDVITYVAVDGERVVGHVLGPLNLDYRNNLNKFLFRYLFFGFIKAIFVHPLRLINLSLKRFNLILLSLKGLLYRKVKTKDFGNERCILLSIAVDPEYQGKGVAKKLNDLFLEEAKIKGKKEVTLSVRASNARAIAFYKKMGWKIFEKEGSSIYFIRYLYEK